MVKLQGQSTTNASSVSQAAALSALSSGQMFLEEWKIEYQKRRDLISDRLGKFFPSSLVNPKGAFYHFISCKPFLGLIAKNGRLIESDSDFCEFLLEDFGVATVPGSEFGSEGYFRLCFAKSEEVLVEASQRIIKAVSSLKKT